jgi:hypothetical protein
MTGSKASEIAVVRDLFKESSLAGHKVTRVRIPAILKRQPKFIKPVASI